MVIDHVKTILNKTIKNKMGLVHKQINQKLSELEAKRQFKLGLLDELDGAEFDRRYGKILDELMQHIN